MATVTSSCPARGAQKTCEQQVQRPVRAFERPERRAVYGTLLTSHGPHHMSSGSPSACACTARQCRCQPHVRYMSLSPYEYLVVVRGGRKHWERPGASCGGRRELPTLARRRSGRAFRPAGARRDDVDAVLNGNPDEACAGDRGRLLGPSGAGIWREIAPVRGDGGRSRLCGRPGRRTPRWARRWCCPAPRPRRVRAAAQGDRR